MLSIVTIHLEDFDGLQRTLDSLRRLLTREDLEWIVIDGGSAFEAAGLQSLREDVSGLARHMVSEPDEGIYQAMNKGTALANGRYVLYLNAGDELHGDFDPGVVTRALGDADPVMIWGQCIEQYRDGRQLALKTRSRRWAWYGMPASHPAIFFERASLGIDPYDCEFRIAADYNLVCRLLKSGRDVLRLDVPVSIFHHGGVSDMLAAQTRAEEDRVRRTWFRVPRIVAFGIRGFKAVMKRLSAWVWFRRIWRSRV
jgi:putative colanic acid biosynthesis glycosyltransferase